MNGMKSNDLSVFPPEVRADLQTVLDHLVTGEPLDPGLVRRVTERSKKVQQELVRAFGVREIAADLIREIRDEE